MTVPNSQKQRFPTHPQRYSNRHSEHVLPRAFPLQCKTESGAHAQHHRFWGLRVTFQLSGPILHFAQEGTEPRDKQGPAGEHRGSGQSRGLTARVQHPASARDFFSQCLDFNGAEREIRAKFYLKHKPTAETMAQGRQPPRSSWS